MIDGGDLQAWRQCCVSDMNEQTKVASWNANSLRAHAEILDMIPFDILAVCSTGVTTQPATCSSSCGAATEARIGTSCWPMSRLAGQHHRVEHRSPSSWSGFS